MPAPSYISDANPKIVKAKELAKDTADVASLDESLRLYREGLEGLVAGAKTDQDARRQHAVKKRAAQWLTSAEEVRASLQQLLLDLDPSLIAPPPPPQPADGTGTGYGYGLDSTFSPPPIATAPEAANPFPTVPTLGGNPRANNDNDSGGFNIPSVPSITPLHGGGGGGYNVGIDGIPSIPSLPPLSGSGGDSGAVGGIGSLDRGAGSGAFTEAGVAGTNPYGQPGMAGTNPYGQPGMAGTNPYGQPVYPSAPAAPSPSPQASPQTQAPQAPPPFSSHLTPTDIPVAVGGVAAPPQDPPMADIFRADFARIATQLAGVGVEGRDATHLFLDAAQGLERMLKDVCTSRGIHVKHPPTLGAVLVAFTQAPPPTFDRALTNTLFKLLKLRNQATHDGILLSASLARELVLACDQALTAAVSNGDFGSPAPGSGAHPGYPGSVPSRQPPQPPGAAGFTGGGSMYPAFE